MPNGVDAVQTQTAAKAIALGYTRVSTYQQVRNNDSLEAQEDEIRRWCTYQRVPLEQVVTDAGITGTEIEVRDGFKDTIRRLLEAGEGSTLIVTKLDRLGRDAIDLQETLAVLEDAKIRVVVLKDGLDTGSEMGKSITKILIGLLSAFAELEHSRVVERLQEGRARARANQLIYANEPPYGWKRASTDKRKTALYRQLVEDPEEQATIVRVRELWQGGEGASLHDIAVQLLEEGRRPRRAEKWAIQVVGRIAKGVREPATKKKNARIERARGEFLNGSAPEARRKGPQRPHAPAFLFKGDPCGRDWAREQVERMRAIAWDDAQILAALEKAGLRAGDGSTITSLARIL